MRLVRVLAMAPWWLLSLLSGAKSFADHPLIGSKTLNQRGLHAARVRWAHALTARRRSRLAHLVSAEDRAAFARDGYVVKPNALPQPLFEAVKASLISRPAPTREMVQGDTITRRIDLDPQLRQALPGLADWLNGPLWQGLCRYVAGYNAAPWTYIQTILSHTREAAPDPQTHLHSDTFHPTMKAWLFLTDVAEDEGPFCYVPGSHRLSPQRLDWERAQSLIGAALPDRYASRGSLRVRSDELSALGLPQAVQIAVAANTLVVADTFGFHARGPSARASMRIEIWAYDRRNPFWPATTDAPLQWLGQMDRRPTLYWRWLDLREKLSGRGNPWRDVGMKRPDDQA